MTGQDQAVQVQGVIFREWTVRELIDRAGYKTIGAFADSIGMSRQALSTAINGNSQPTLAVAAAVAKALGVSIEEITETVPGLELPKGGGRSSRAAVMVPALASVA